MPRKLTLPRFYPILDTAAIQRCGLGLMETAQALLTAGALILQLRHKGHFDRDTYAGAQQIAALCRESGCLFVINDRVDIAKLIDTAVHLGQDDLPLWHARKLLGDTPVLGLSTHNEAQLSAAGTEPVDYVALGPIFGTTSKHNPDPVVGLEELRRLKPTTRLPLVAIGGITRSTAPEVWASGADSIAVVGDLYPDVRRSAEEWLKLS